MADERTYPVTALVLRSRDYGEGHRMITLLTREEGKVFAVAKGVRKPKARLAAALQHFTLGEMQLARGRRFDVITQVRVLQPFYGLRASLDAVAYASYLAELFDAALAERQPQPVLFDLLVQALCRLHEGATPPDLLARYVEISLIAISGYLPQLAHCAHCRAPLAHPGPDGHPVWPTWLGFSAGHGGALCPACLPAVPGARRIAAGTVQVAQLLLAKGLDAVEGLHLSARLRRELETTFREYLEYRLEQRLQSVKFLRSLGDPAPSSPDDLLPENVAYASQE